LVAYQDKGKGRLLYPSASLFELLRKTERVLRVITENFTRIKDLSINEVLYNLRVYFSVEFFFAGCRGCAWSLYEVGHKSKLIHDVGLQYVSLRIRNVLQLKNQSYCFKRNLVSRHTMNTQRKTLLVQISIN
jgi:hypothetical protein